MQRKQFIITNELGLCARTATILINFCVNFKSVITLNALKKSVDFKSIMGVMSLGVYAGTEIEVVVEGEDEALAMDEITKKINELKVAKEIEKKY